MDLQKEEIYPMVKIRGKIKVLACHIVTFWNSVKHHRWRMLLEKKFVFCLQLGEGIVVDIITENRNRVTVDFIARDWIDWAVLNNQTKYLKVMGISTSCLDSRLSSERKCQTLLGQHFRARVAILDQYQPAAFITTEQTTTRDSCTFIQKKSRGKNI